MVDFTDKGRDKTKWGNPAANIKEGRAKEVLPEDLMTGASKTALDGLKKHAETKPDIPTSGAPSEIAGLTHKRTPQNRMQGIQ